MAGGQVIETAPPLLSLEAAIRWLQRRQREQRETLPEHAEPAVAVLYEAEILHDDLEGARW